MSFTEPISDMLTRIRNALVSKHESVLVPASRTKISIAKVLKEEGFIKDYEVLKGNTPQRVVKVHLSYAGKKHTALIGLKRGITMSRVGNRPITVPNGVEVSIKGNEVTVKGPKGQLSRSVPEDMSIL